MSRTLVVGWFHHLSDPITVQDALSRMLDLAALSRLVLTMQAGCSFAATRLPPACPPNPLPSFPAYVQANSIPAAQRLLAERQQTMRNAAARLRLQVQSVSTLRTLDETITADTLDALDQAFAGTLIHETFAHLVQARQVTQQCASRAIGHRIDWAALSGQPLLALDRCQPLRSYANRYQPAGGPLLQASTDLTQAIIEWAGFAGFLFSLWSNMGQQGLDPLDAPLSQYGRPQPVVLPGQET